MSARALIGVTGTALGLMAALTASAFIWITFTDPLWMVTMVARMFMGLW